MRNRLIILIDFSPASATLLQLANAWSAFLQADLLLVHQVPKMAPALVDDQTRAEIVATEKATAVARLKELSEATITTSGSISYHISEQSLLVSLPELLAQAYHHFVLVGIKGTGILKQIFLGSTATKIIEELNHTVVAVSAGQTHFLPKRLIVALHYQYPLNETAFTGLLQSLAGVLQHIEFIAIADTPESVAAHTAYLEKVSENCASQVPSSFRVFQGGNPFREIRALAAQETDAFIVVQKGGRSLSDYVFRKFLINDLVHDGSMPLIIIPL